MPKKGLSELQKIAKDLTKDELLELAIHYDWYIQDANEKDLFVEGWRPVCMAEFYDNEYQMILEEGLERDRRDSKEVDRTELNGTIGYRIQIEGYWFRVVELKSGYISFGAPMGDTPEDKEMFDRLVYYKQSIYNGKTKDKEKIVKRIADWIKAYKGTKEGLKKLDKCHKCGRTDVGLTENDKGQYTCDDCWE